MLLKRGKMKKVSIPVKPENKLNIKSSEDLYIEGSNSGLMTAVVRQSDSFRYTEYAGKGEVKVTSDCWLSIPAAMPVTIEKVGGDASLTNLATRIIIGKVGGDLVLQNLDGASIEAVGGDLHVNSPGGEGLEIVRVGGDLYGTSIQSLSVRAVGGDVFLQQVSGAVNLTAGGDIEIELTVPELPLISVTAGGDVCLVVPGDARGQLDLHSKGYEIGVHAGEQQGDWEEEQLSLPLGEGGNPVRLTAGGKVTVTDKADLNRDNTSVINDSINDWKTFGEEIEKQIRESIGSAMNNIHWATRSASDAGDKARVKMEKARRKMEAKGVSIDHTGVNVNHNGKNVGITFGTPGSKPETEKSGVSDEERLLVLKMLQDKKITADEADKLLSALEK